MPKPIRVADAAKSYDSGIGGLPPHPIKNPFGENSGSNTPKAKPNYLAMSRHVQGHQPGQYASLGSSNQVLSPNGAMNYSNLNQPAVIGGSNYSGNLGGPLSKTPGFSNFAKPTQQLPTQFANFNSTS